MKRKIVKIVLGASLTLVAMGVIPTSFSGGVFSVQEAEAAIPTYKYFRTVQVYQGSNIPTVINKSKAAWGGLYNGNMTKLSVTRDKNGRASVTYGGTLKLFGYY
ncbi:hypothetical protein P7E02_05975 [Enterococcus hulanensis]|uniref:hypothetical protein n=1 Tax=Enterococcus hulanensis TaxID=2559929 RepID=UPI00288D3E89|nr:hypothetical protein [Enterococcus hulanensis]MDT2659405.1 hypothetical protein [Enterococcus hulanensis]